jgi:hypothetical protein
MYGHAGRLLAKLQRYDEAAEVWLKEAQYWRQAGYLQETIAAERKAEWVCSEVRLFTTAPSEAVANRYYTGGKYEPVVGSYLGVYAELDPLVHDWRDGNPFYTHAFAATVGRQHPIFLLYGNWGQSFPRGHAAKIKAAGGALQWALQPIHGLAEVQDGPYIREVARAAREAGIPIFLRFGGEMNGNWVPWHGDPALYKEKFRLVARIFREEAPNVVMLWAPGDFPPYTMSEYYPGDAVVDWVGISAYGVFNGSLDPVAPPGQGHDSRALNDSFAEVYRLFAGRKPIMLAEGAIGYYDHYLKQDRTEWAITNIRRFYAAMPRLYPYVKALVWYDVDMSRYPNSDHDTRQQNYQLTAHPQVLAAYRQAIADSYYLSQWGAKPGQVYLDAQEAGIPPHPVELSSYVKAYETYLSRVEYAIGERVIGVSTAGDPWAISADFTPYAGQKVEITVRAYGRDGRVVVERKMPVRVGSARVTMAGKTLAFDYQPRIVEGVLLVPLRHIAMQVGATLTSGPEGVVLERAGQRVEINFGSRVAYVNGQAVTLRAAPVVESGRTLVPLRLLESMGFRIGWDKDTWTAHIE